MNFDFILSGSFHIPNDFRWNSFFGVFVILRGEDELTWRQQISLKKKLLFIINILKIYSFIYLFIFPLLIFSCTFLRISYGHRIQSEICIYPWPVCQKFWAWPSAAAAAVQFFLLSRAIWISFVFVSFPLYSFSNWRVDWWVATSVSFVVYPSNCCYFILFCFFKSN